jgi:hypothetical protein
LRFSVTLVALTGCAAASVSPGGAGGGGGAGEATPGSSATVGGSAAASSGGEDLDGGAGGSGGGAASSGAGGGGGAASSGAGGGGGAGGASGCPRCVDAFSGPQPFDAAAHLCAGTVATTYFFQLLACACNTLGNCADACASTAWCNGLYPKLMSFTPRTPGCDACLVDPNACGPQTKGCVTH